MNGTTIRLIEVAVMMLACEPDRWLVDVIRKENASGASFRLDRNLNGSS
jgi:hypothetical protein